MRKIAINWIMTRVVFCLLTMLAIKAWASVQITNLKDFDFGTVFPPYSGNFVQNDRVCIYNSDATSYRITVTGMHDVGNDPFLASGNNTIRYRVRWDGPVGPFRTLNMGQANDFDGASQTLLCSGVPNNQRPRLRIVIRNSWLSPTPLAGSYSDTLTILLEPV